MTAIPEFFLDAVSPIIDPFLGNRIYHRRKQLKLQQTPIAERLGISQSCLSKLEGGSLSTQIQLSALCRILQVEPEKFLDRSADHYSCDQQRLSSRKRARKKRSRESTHSRERDENEVRNQGKKGV